MDIVKKMINECKALLKSGRDIETIHKAYGHLAVWPEVQKELGRFASNRTLMLASARLMLEAEMERQGVRCEYIVFNNSDKIMVCIRLGGMHMATIPIYFNDKLETRIKAIVEGIPYMQQLVAVLPKNWKISHRHTGKFQWNQMADSLPENEK